MKKTFISPEVNFIEMNASENIMAGVFKASGESKAYQEFDLGVDVTKEYKMWKNN